MGLIKFVTLIGYCVIHPSPSTRIFRPLLPSGIILLESSLLAAPVHPRRVEALDPKGENQHRFLSEFDGQISQLLTPCVQDA